MKNFYLTLLCLFFAISVSFSQDKLILGNSDFQNAKASILLEEYITLPLPTGDQQFKKEKSTLVNASFRRKNPQLEIFELHNSEQGARGVVVIGEETMMYSIIKNGSVFQGKYNHSTCDFHVEKGIVESAIKCDLITTTKPKEFSNKRSNLEIGQSKKTYRLAVITTGEFTLLNTILGTDVMASVLWSIGTANLVFQGDVSIEFELGERVYIYDNIDNDPFTPTLGSGAPNRTVQSTKAFAEVFDQDDYDVGITLNYNTGDWPGGGVAYLENACSNTDLNGPKKAGNWATASSGIDYSFVSVICHELGHAFGAKHTMNSGSFECLSAVSENDAYEIGAGYTIMSYASGCSDFYSFGGSLSSLYFHNKTIELMHNYSKNSTCGVITQLSNDIPVLDINPCNINERKIPLDTPFFLDAKATDDSDSLGYVWEQIDEDGPGFPNRGFIGNLAANSTEGPLFRNYPISNSSRRDIPVILLDLFDDYRYERLPLVPREMNFSCTVRDNHSGGGGVVSDVLTIDVVDIPQFKVQLSDEGDFLTAGSTIQIKWSDDGVADLCDKVDIHIENANGVIISEIATNIDFSDLQAPFVVPEIIGDEDNFAVRVTCSDYDCFGFYNRSDFKRITGSCSDNFRDYFSCDIDDLTVDAGSNILLMDIDMKPGKVLLKMPKINLTTNDASLKFVRENLQGNCEEVFFDSGNNLYSYYQLFDLNVSKTAEYRFSFFDLRGALIIFEKDKYDSDNPCLSFVGSTVTESSNSPGTITTVFYTSLRIELEECKDYYLAVTDYSEGSYGVEAYELNYYGLTAVSNQMLSNDFYYLILDNEMKVVQVLDNSDFRSLPPGEFHIQPLSLQSGNIDETDFLGLEVDEVKIGNNCIYFSSSIFKLTLIGDVDNDGFTNDIDCDDDDPAINPGAEEIPNNDIDENCDGEVLIIDADMDGFNSDEDCDDMNASVNPSATEIPNNDIDENCDGEVLIFDVDMDGFNSDEDCDDMNAIVNPGAEEVPNNDIDENCDGEILIIDADMDGFNSDEDCDDMNASVNPSATEIPNNDIDENCDGEALIFDADMDGFNSDEDCDDMNAAVNPGATEIPNNDIDENCDGEALVIDLDMDGFNSDEDCDDMNAAINPDAEEIANNNIDENCDGEDLLSSLKEELLSKVKIYPNPVSDYLVIELDAKQYEINFVNTSGQRIFTSQAFTDYQKIALKEWTNGLYYLTIKEVENGNEIVVKVIKI